MKIKKYINWTPSQPFSIISDGEPARFEGEEALKKCTDILNGAKGVPVYISWAGKRPYSLEGFEIASIYHDHAKDKSIISLRDNKKLMRDKLVWPCEKADIKKDEYPLMGLEVWG